MLLHYYPFQKYWLLQAISNSFRIKQSETEHPDSEMLSIVFLFNLFHNGVV